MKRYCYEEFRNLKFGNSDIDKEKFEMQLRVYLERCQKKAMCSENEFFKTSEWEKYRLEEADRISLMYNMVQGQDILLVDDTISVEYMRERMLSEKQKFKIDANNRDLRIKLKMLMTSVAAKNGIMSELYLAYKKIIAESVDWEWRFTEEERERAKYYIDNVRKKKIIKKEFPFDADLKQISQGVSEFGVDVLCLWLSSPLFRNIFDKVKNKSEKYRLENFCKCFSFGDIEDFDEDGKKRVLKRNILEGTENDLILDKMVGGTIILTFCEYVYPHIEDFNKEEVELYVFCLLEQVIQCQSNHICCEILKIIADEMKRFPNSSKEFRIKKLLLYTEYVEKILPEISKQYKDLCAIIAYNIDNQWSEEALKYFVETWDETRKSTEMECYIYDIHDLYRLEYNNIDRYLTVYDDVKIIESIIAFATEKCCKRYR